MEKTTMYMTICYFLTYRLSVLLLGGVSLYLGYKLFVRGYDQGRTDLQGQNDQASQGEMSAKFGAVNLTLKNAAPGIFFAAFGAIITTVILMGSPPQFDYSSGGESVDSRAATASVSVRGGGEGGFHHQIWQVEYPVLLKLGRESVQADPENPDYHDTLAALYFLGEQYAKAVEQQGTALTKARAAGVTTEGIGVLQKKLGVYRDFLP